MLILPDKSDSVNLRDVPAELRAVPQWLAWLSQPRARGKPAKVPISPLTLQPTDPTKECNWSPFEEAERLFREHGLSGVGFVFGDDQRYAGVDLDHCRCPENGALDQWAEEVVAQLSTYAEVSPSGSGVKLFSMGPLPAGRRRAGPVEMYDRRRFFAVTGWRLRQSPARIEDRHVALAEMHARLFPAAPSAAIATGIAGGWSLADADLVARACQAKNGAKFARLWAGDWSGYPSQSEADCVLCHLLAFWAGPDSARIDALFRQSGLMRPKWNARRGRQSYGALTIIKAIASQGVFWRPNTGAGPGSNTKPPTCDLYVSDLAKPTPHPLAWVMQKILAAKGCGSLPADTRKRREFLPALCQAFQEHAQGEAFPLPCRTVAALLGVATDTAARWIRDLQTAGFLKLTRHGRHDQRLASEYRIAG